MISSSGNAEHPADGARECRVDDGHAAGSEIVVTRDGCRVDGGYAVAREVVREFLGWLRRVQQDPAAGLETRRDLGPDQGRVEHDDVIGLVDQVAIGDGIVCKAAERLDRGPGSFCGIETESLYRLSL